MKILKLLFWNSILLICAQSIGQNFNVIDSLFIIKKSDSQKLFEELYQNEKRPLIIINNLFFDNIDNLPSDEINTTLVLKGKEALKKYGNGAQNGVIILTLKNENSLEFIKFRNNYQLEKTSNITQKILDISGEIISLNGNSLSDVIISNLNKKESYYCDIDGKYSLKAHKNDVLVYFKNGFESKKIVANEQSIIDVVLYPIKESKLGEMTIKKPVIYLYPTEKTDIKLTLDFKGKLQTTYPKYVDNWEVTAYPNGQIFDKKSQRFYDSLFWDGMLDFPKEHYNYQTGFVIPKNKLTSFLIEKLEFIGLNTSETNDFIQYWLPLLEKNELNFIHFYVNSEYEIISKNTIDPNPETSIRLFMEFYGIEKSMNIPEQKLVKTERKGFTLVEWGGSEVSIPENKLKN
ncbi:MAG: hypothetical protein KA210_10195 [Bacteroidia bacterium]|nr:hypothetical protein [Bacteroidia bacterium]